MYRKPRWLVFNKSDLAEDADARIRKILRALRWRGSWFKVSALTGDGCKQVCGEAHRLLAASAARPSRARRIS